MGDWNSIEAEAQARAKLLVQALQEKARAHKVWASSVLLVALLFAGATTYGWLLRRKTESLQLQADEHARESAKWKARAEQSEALSRLTQAQRDEAHAENVRLKAKIAATPAPRPQVPAPQADADLASGLAAKGVLTPLPKIEAIKVWDWSEDSLQLPEVKVHLGLAQDYAKGLERENGLLSLENTQVFNAKEAYRVSLEAKSKEAVALTDKGLALEKTLKVERFNTKIKIVVTAAVTAELTKRLITGHW